MTAEIDMQTLLLHRDGLILVVNKPSNINVHTGPKGDTALEDFFDQLQFGLPRKPSLAHRLDKETSGCLILGRHPKALRKLGQLFSENKITKTYWAICDGLPEKSEGLIDLPLYKDKRGKVHKMHYGEHKNAKPAQTAWRVLGKAKGQTLIECKPLTGRTHQIRAHLQAIGLPIVGDQLYGSEENKKAPLLLHARSVVIPLSKNKPALKVEAPAPETMNRAMAAFEEWKNV